MTRTSGIGSSFDTRGRVWVAGGIGIAAVAADLALCGVGTTDLQIRALPALVVVAGLLWLSHGQRENLGLRFHPKQGWRYWVVPSAIVGGAVLFVSGVYLLVFPTEWQGVLASGQDLADYGAWDRFVYSCLETPPVEEAVYRLVLCASLVSIIGHRAAVLASGLVFASLHFVYGNPGPDNAVAGFVFAWAYLTSETVTIPIIMHACGNLAVIGIQLGAAALAR